MALGDPSLLTCWEPPHTSMTAIRRKQVLVTNLTVTNWESDFRLGDLSEAAFRDLLDGHFQGEIAREHWAAGGAGWRVSAQLSADRYAASSFWLPTIATRRPSLAAHRSWPLNTSRSVRRKDRCQAVTDQERRPRPPCSAPARTDYRSAHAL
ncbi:DUF6082 family protein [Streptomyces sp. 900105245]